MRYTISIIIHTIFLVLNGVQLLLLLLYFWGTVFSYNAYLAFTIFEYVTATIAGLYLYIKYIDEPIGSHVKCEAVPCFMSAGYHAVAHIVIADIFSTFPVGSMLFMIGVCINSINVFISYLRNAGYNN